jgi:hypothetical protein
MDVSPLIDSFTRLAKAQLLVRGALVGWGTAIILGAGVYFMLRSARSWTQGDKMPVGSAVSPAVASSFLFSSVLVCLTLIMCMSSFSRWLAAPFEKMKNLDETESLSFSDWELTSRREAALDWWSSYWSGLEYLTVHRGDKKAILVTPPALSSIAVSPFLKSELFFPTPDPKIFLSQSALKFRAQSHTFFFRVLAFLTYLSGMFLSIIFFGTLLVALPQWFTERIVRRRFAFVVNHVSPLTGRLVLLPHPFPPLNFLGLRICRFQEDHSPRSVTILLCPKSLQQDGLEGFAYDISEGMGWFTKRLLLPRNTHVFFPKLLLRESSL